MLLRMLAEEMKPDVLCVPYIYPAFYALGEAPWGKGGDDEEALVSTLLLPCL